MNLTAEAPDLTFRVRFMFAVICSGRASSVLIHLCTQASLLLLPLHFLENSFRVMEPKTGEVNMMKIMSMFTQTKILYDILVQQLRKRT